MNEHYQQLVQLVKEQAGRNLRSAFCYDADDWTALYVRTDLATDDLQSAVPSLAERARSQEPLVRNRDYPGLGEQRASVFLHENAVLVQFDEPETESGIVLTLDSDVARNLSQFVAECETVLADPQRRQ
ncbi:MULTISPECIES: DUF7522 family protein [Halolamina]|uniref:Uncharacterized protein n=1 Tax=Halolamina pelagica TaxID=699431 RepID=A0A1I5NWN6_9EURY|nr:MULTISPECIES: hypothetical protein [Halolamina]NHX36513.1 hypothetical protein [Halolamina sp. R1-12]SFP26172.1 hypothetical protein SAMN05216277_102229 [Halolamina pelagica]